MMSKKVLADEFIKLHLEKFGLNGSNTKKNPPAGFPAPTVSSDFDAKPSSGVKFGYNGQTFNWRESSTCMFWVDYGNFKKPAGPLKAELNRSLQSISENLKTFSIPFFGSNFSWLMCHLLSNTKYSYYISIPACTNCKELNFEQEFSSEFNDSPHLTEKIERIEFSKEELENFLETMSTQVRCVDPVAAFSTFIGIRSKYPHVYHSPWPQIRDENFDAVSGHAVGPSNWTIVDNESDFSIARFLMKNKIDGIYNLFYSYPNLIAAILYEPSWQNWLKESSLSEFRKPNADLFMSEKLLHEVFSETYSSISWISASNYLSQFKEQLLSKYPKANESWLTPLHRLIEKMGIPYNFGFCQNEEVYGLVLKDQRDGRT